MRVSDEEKEKEEEDEEEDEEEEEKEKVEEKEEEGGGHGAKPSLAPLRARLDRKYRKWGAKSPLKHQTLMGHHIRTATQKPAALSE